jgi:DNA-3-methyladenine glycosylase
MRLDREFYNRDVLLVAPELIGKKLVRNIKGQIDYYPIIEVEAYHGEEDKASHARFGKTSRNSIMYSTGGLVYVYLIYGMYWMLNIVTGDKDSAQAVLIRGLQGFEGPGKVTKALGIDKTFYGEDLVYSDRIWIETHLENPSIIHQPRIGIDYACEPWKSVAWRYILDINQTRK